jgi:hypothetical protein
VNDGELQAIADTQAVELRAQGFEFLIGDGLGAFKRREMNFKIVIEGNENKPVYWPFWPFRLDRATLRFQRGFRVMFYQRDGSLLNADPIDVQGYASNDGVTLTTTVDFKGGSRLKRVTQVEEE